MDEDDIWNLFWFGKDDTKGKEVTGSAGGEDAYQERSSTDDLSTRKFKNVRPLLDKIADYIRGCYMVRFQQGGDPSWLPLAASTRLAKSGTSSHHGLLAALNAGKGGGGTGTLVDTGALRDSYTIAGAYGQVVEYDEQNVGVSISSNIPYAGYHQYGGKSWYDILPRSAHKLSFMGSNGPVLTGYVRHPPLPKRAVTLTDAEKAIIQKMIQDYQDEEREP